MVRILVRTLFLFSILIFISGCATPRQWAPGINYAPNSDKCPADKACIYVIRPAVSIGGAAQFYIVDNKSGIGITGPGSYLAWARDPGTVNLVSQGENDVKLDFKAEAGQTYYVLQALKMGMMSADSSLKLITKEEAMGYLKSCSPASGSGQKEKPQHNWTDFIIL